MTRGILVYGSGGHGRVVADAALAAGFHVHGFADDDPEKRGIRVLDLPVVAVGLAEVAGYCREGGAGLVIAVGDNRARQRIYRAARGAGIEIATVVHPSAVIAASASLGPGSVVLANAVVNPAARVGENVIINTAAAVDHDSVIGDHGHLAPGARTGGTVRIGEGTMLGISACVRNNIVVGMWSMIGMGSVVVGDLPDRILAWGNPARVQGEYEP